MNLFSFVIWPFLAYTSNKKKLGLGNGKRRKAIFWSNVIADICKSKAQTTIILPTTQYSSDFYKKKVYVDNGCLVIITRNHVSKTKVNIVADLYNMPVSRIGYM